MEVHLLGVRGSTPAPGAPFVRYGGETSCVAVAHSDAAPTLLLDAGTGARRLSNLLADAPFRGALLLTHLHWDHTHGIPFARALDHPGAVVELRLPAQRLRRPATEVLADVMAPPHFPITPSDLRGTWTFTAQEPATFSAGGFTVTAIEVPHKGGRTFGYRVTDGSTTIAYAPDHGPVALGPGPDGFGTYHRSALDLADRVDLLLHDAQHTAADFPASAGFGHSAVDYAVGLGARADSREVVLVHHHPDRTDEQLDAIGRCWSAARAPIVTVGRQGAVFHL